jgi:glycosyltransferase involved in cell wall biosynthesis
MKILYFSRDYTPHDHRFLSFLAGSGHETGFLQLEQGAQPLEGRPLPPEVLAIHWPGGRSRVGWGDYPRLGLGLKKVIREFQPDLIQAGPIQGAAFLAALVGFHPLVTMSWGYDLLVDAHRNRWWEWATRYTLKHSDAMVGDCETIRDLAARYGMKRDRIVTFPWGIDLEKFTPSGDRAANPIRQRLGWGGNTFVLLSTRGWSPIYGVEDLARAFVDLVHQYPQMRLLMLGNGPLAPAIHQIFRQGQVLEAVHFPGQVSQDKLPDYYRAADVYISTSHSDGTSISLLEALGCGIPVILANIPGNREWVTRPGEVGWLFRDGDVQALRQALQQAFEERDRLLDMGQQARILAERRADWAVNAQSLFDAYKLACA